MSCIPGGHTHIPGWSRCLALLLSFSILAGCESDEHKLARLHKEAETLCSGLQNMRGQLDSAFGFWMMRDTDTLAPIMAAYGDSLKYWYDKCEFAIRDYNRFRQDVGGTSKEMRMPAAP